MAVPPDSSRNTNNQYRYEYRLAPLQSTPQSQQYYSGPSTHRPPPLPPRDVVTVFTHRPRKSSGESRDSHLLSPTSPEYPHHRFRAPAPIESYPLTPLSPSESSTASRSAGSPVSSPKSSTSSSTTTSSFSTVSQQNPSTSSLSKARFKMPFRDRVARRFGETVSAPHSTSSPSEHGYYMTPALPFAHDHLPTPPSTPHHFSDPADGYDFYLDEYDCNQSQHYNSLSTAADPRVGLRRGRRAGHGRRKNTRLVELKNRDTTSQDALAREALGPHTRRSGRIVKSKNSKLGSTRPKGPGSRQVAATTGSSRSTCSTRSSFTPTYQNLLNTSDGRQWGTRVTRSRSKMTDDDGKQLSPTSPFLSCKYSPSSYLQHRFARKSD